jgi:tRNA-dihydrouridine synthase B
MTFSIGTIPFNGNVLLAPMDGYTSLPYRIFVRRLGSAGSYSEFIGAIEVTQKHPHLDEKIGFSDEERPFAYQIFDNDPLRILRAAEILRKRNPDFIDLNLGCSAKQVSFRGAGAGLLKDPEKISFILELLVKNLDIPITAKIRLGWDMSTLNYLDVSKRVEQAGCSAIAIHARTRSQGYKGDADWNAISEIKRKVSIPVIGNGDVKNPPDIERMLERTGCDAVMIGRAALTNPWIFSRVERSRVDNQRLLNDIQTLIQLMQDYYGSNRGLIMCRKFIARYILPYKVDPEMRKQLLTSLDKDDVLVKIRNIIQTQSLSPQ